MADALLALVIVTHNSAGWLPAFAASWDAAVTHAPAVVAAGVEVVVADSGSKDETMAVVGKLFPGSKMLICGNVGFGTAVNRAVDAARAPWVLLCNPDLTFPVEFAERLLGPLAALGKVELTERPDWLGTGSGCIAPRLLNSDGSEQPSVGRFPTVGAMMRDQFRRREMRKYVFPQPSCARPVDWATGACLLLHRNRFLSVGGFDEKYFLYVEEVDLQRRLRDTCHPTWFVPEVTVFHHQPNAVREPRPEVQRWAARGMLRYLRNLGRG